MLYCKSSSALDVSCDNLKASPLLSRLLKNDKELIFLSKGMCTMVGVSWYAFNITQEFFDPFHPGIR